MKPSKIIIHDHNQNTAPLVKSVDDKFTGADMTSKVLRWVLGVLGLLFILSSLTIALVEYNRYNNTTSLIFPPGSIIAGIPVGGLDVTAAEERLLNYYNLPLVLEYNNAIIHAQPDELGFTIEVTSLVDSAVNQINTGGFWAHLWNQTTAETVDIPVSANVEEEQVLNYLNNEIVPRYTQPGNPITPIIWTTNFKRSETGQTLAVEQAASEIQAALFSPGNHKVTLIVSEETEITNPALDMLEAFLRHNINWTGYNDLIEIYLESMSTGQKLQFAVWNGEVVEPDIAFPAASTNKIPIMMSVLRRTSTPTPDAVAALFERMIAFSENPPADILMSRYLDEIRGPLIVSEDMAELGMVNTFLGMYYTDETPLELYTTPANTRQDIFLNPDRFNQTTSSESGQLLSAIYKCAETGSSLITETFPNEITQPECRLMVDTMGANIIGILIESGLPPEGSAAHKHGYAPDLDGQLRFMSDVAIVFTPGGDYVLNIFLHSPSRLDFDQGNRLVARVSQTVYNYFNLDNQAHWWFD